MASVSGMPKSASAILPCGTASPLTQTGFSSLAGLIELASTVTTWVFNSPRAASVCAEHPSFIHNTGKASRNSAPPPSTPLIDWPSRSNHDVLLTSLMSCSPFRLAGGGTYARRGGPGGGDHLRGGAVGDAELLPLGAGAVHEQARGGHVDAGAGVLDQDDVEAGPAEVAGGIETADVLGDAADDHGGDATGAVEVGQARVLGGDGVGLVVALEPLAPDGVELLGVQPGQELGAGRAH